MNKQSKKMTALPVADQNTGYTWKGLSVGIFMVGLAVFLLTGCKDKKQEQAGPPPAPVAVEAAVIKSVPVQIRTMGNVEAYTTVGVKAQISGTLTRVHFSEGKDVKKGALLFSIDPRPFEAALRQAEATLAKDRAQFENAKKDAERYSELAKKGYVSLEQHEQLRTNADALSAVLQADLALVENAKLQLGYCSIYAPVSGRAGGLLLHAGNLVKANDDTPMVVINQIEPVYVTFSVPEKDLYEIRKYMAQGKLEAEALISPEDKSPVKGSLSFIDNAVDKATGTIMMKATFANEDRRLWPGQFVNVVMTLAVRSDATVVPSAAVQTGQQGQFVFVVKGESAELRPVIAGIEYEGLTVIEKGVTPGEQVVTDGQVRIIPGGKVVIKQPQNAKGEEQRTKNEEQGKDVGRNGLSSLQAKDKAE